MPDVHERIFNAGQNYFSLSRDAFNSRDFKSAAELSASTLGIFSFLLEDDETPEEIRQYIDQRIETVRSRIVDSEARWIRRKVESRMQGRGDSLSEQVQHMETAMRQAARAGIEGDLIDGHS